MTIESGAVSVGDLADRAFLDLLRHLHALGAAKAEAFLAAHFDDIGQRSSTNITEKFV